MKISWQYWALVALGIWLLISPWQMDYTLDHAASTNAAGMGSALVVFNLICAGRLLEEGQEILNVVLGAWLVFSPYSLSFSAEKGPTVNAIAVGIAVAVLAISQMVDAARLGKK